MNPSYGVLMSLLLVCFVSSEDRCEPGFTDNCFSAVHKDLQLIINSNNTSFKRYTNDYLEKLCNAIDDALNCTSDVIDTDCSEDEGRGRFDKWNMAFLQTYYELCDCVGNDDKIILRAIVYQLRCWNATHFVDCMQTTAGLSSIHHLMSTEINKNECDILYQTFESCRVNQMQTTKYLCTHRQTVEAVSIVHHLFDIFMSSSHCSHHYMNAIHSIHQKIIENQFNDSVVSAKL